MTLYFPWDKDILQKNYMGNEQALLMVDRMFENTILLAEMDSIVMTAYASPEGNKAYNQRLSERRLRTIRNYILNHFPTMESDKVKGYAMGENWTEMVRMITADPDIPGREEVLRLLASGQDQALIKQQLYRLPEAYGYISRNILPYLRTGGTFVIFYPKRLDVNLLEARAIEPILVILPSVEPIEPIHIPAPDTFVWRRPFSLKTNLLFDAATLFNVELEVPLGKRFSLLGEWTFPFWGGLGNRGGVAPIPAYSEKYTMQMLTGGLEARYWFPRSNALDEKARRWGDYNPLNGWFVGMYGGAGLYDFQFGKSGMQGDFYIASGISAGFAHPIGKCFHLEYSLGVDYLATTYYNYTLMDGHKVVDIRPDGRFDRRKQSFVGPTKLKVSLIWIPRFKVKSKKRSSHE